METNTKLCARKRKSLLMIYADFERILLPENIWKQNPDQPYAIQYQNHVGCNFNYKLVRIDDLLASILCDI